MRTRDELILAVNERCVDEVGEIPQGVFIESPDGPVTQPYTDRTYCRAHGMRVAARLTARTGLRHFATEAWSGDDGVRTCKICQREVDNGGLTSHGVDSALALTEEDPAACELTWPELVLSANSLVKSDPRWEYWERRAREMLARGEHRIPVRSR